MKRFIFFVIFLSSSGAFSSEVDRLLAQYEPIESVSCQIRRTVKGPEGKIQFISRVYWQNDDRLHVDNLRPVRRRIISDGTTFFSLIEGDPRGFSRPVSDLSEKMAVSLEKIPGTAMDHLLRLKGLDENRLPPDNTAGKRVGIQAENHYVVLAFDPMDRLMGILFYQTSDMKNQTAEYAYSHFYEAGPGVWVPFLHKATLTMADEKFEETVRVDNFVVNRPIAKSLFVSSAFFTNDIDFVDEFSKIRPQLQEKQ